MFERQIKNTIKTIAITLAMVILGEGVLGWGLYWPFLFVRSEWGGIFWLSFVVGILVSVFQGIAIGPASLFIVLVMAAVAFFVGDRKGVKPFLLILAVIVNRIFDAVFGLSWSVWEMIGVVIAGLFVFSLVDRSDTIKISY